MVDRVIGRCYWSPVCAHFFECEKRMPITMSACVLMRHTHLLFQPSTLRASSSMLVQLLKKF